MVEIHLSTHPIHPEDPGYQKASIKMKPIYNMRKLEKNEFAPPLKDVTR